MSAPALRVSGEPARPGDPVVVAGFPESGPYRAEPARVRTLNLVSAPVSLHEKHQQTFAVGHASREDALRFYKRYYAPNNAILVVAGDVTPEEVKRLAKDNAAALAKQDDAIDAAEKLATMSNEQGQKYNIEGTPTFFINGKKQDFNTWPQLKDALIKAGAR